MESSVTDKIGTPAGKRVVSVNLIRNVVVGILLVMLGGVIGYRYGQTNLSPTKIPLSQVMNTKVPLDRQDSVDFGVFWEVWNYLDQRYFDPDKLDARKMVNGAIGGMTAAVGDPYTTYLPPADNQRSSEDLAGSFYGVGIELGYIDNTLAVIAPVKGTPAEKAGIQAGDLIIHFKDETKGLDEDTTGWSLNQAVDNIRGPKNSTVVFTLLRRDAEGQSDDGAPAGSPLPYGEPFTVSVTRQEIIVESVELVMVERSGKKVAHLAVSRFGERTPKEFDEAVKKIAAEKNQLNGVVLDLRNNPGGFFDGAIDMASEFIASGTVVTQKGKFTQQDYNTQGKARLQGMNVEVLVNRGSASASEIVAGALRDQLGSKLIGEKTFGKGTVQDRTELSNGGGLHITIARWLLPKGDWIQDAGIPVDIEVSDNPDTAEDEVLLKAIEVI